MCKLGVVLFLAKFSLTFENTALCEIGSLSVISFSSSNGLNRTLRRRDIVGGVSKRNSGELDIEWDENTPGFVICMTGPRIIAAVMWGWGIPVRIGIPLGTLPGATRDPMGGRLCDRGDLLLFVLLLLVVVVVVLLFTRAPAGPGFACTFCWRFSGFRYLRISMISLSKCESSSES